MILDTSMDGKQISWIDLHKKTSENDGFWRENERGIISFRERKLTGLPKEKEGDEQSIYLRIRLFGYS